MATNTIRFIESQIIKTQDSLENIENKLKDFKKKIQILKSLTKSLVLFFRNKKLKVILHNIAFI